MKWVTRQQAKVDRVACSWLIKHFVDKHAKFIFIPADQVLEFAEREGAIPFDVEGAALGHHSDLCSFKAIVDTYDIDDPAIKLLAEIVNDADITHKKPGKVEAAGLRAIAEGFAEMGLKDDNEIIVKESIVFDALYAYCKQKCHPQ